VQLATQAGAELFHSRSGDGFLTVGIDAPTSPMISPARTVNVTPPTARTGGTGLRSTRRSPAEQDRHIRHFDNVADLVHDATISGSS
jgi:hypothetical protein